MALISFRIRIEGLDELEANIARLEREYPEVTRQAIATVTLGMQKAAMARCPVRTGQTRAAIVAHVGNWRGGRLRAAVWMKAPPAAWGAELEKKHGMFQAAYQFGHRNLQSELDRALTDLINRIFGN